MSKHNSLKQFHANLVCLAIQGRALLSCEDIGPDQVDAYKQLIDGVLEESDMRLEDIDQLAAAKALQNQQVAATTYSLEAETTEEDDELDVVETDATVDEIVEAELAEEEPVVEEVDSEDGTIDVLPPELDADADGDIDVDVDVDAAADDLVEAAEDPVLEEEPVVAEELPPEEESLDVNEADETAALTGEEPEKEPIQELEATVDKVDHIVQRVETYIAVTEDSGLTTDDVQAMAASNESFAAIRDLGRLSKTVKRTANAEIISAYHRLTCLSLRNIGKAIQ